MTHGAAAPLRLVAIISLALATTAAAQPQGSEPAATRQGGKSLRQCINTTFTTSWTPYDDTTILVDSGGRQFLVKTNRCSGLTSILPRIDTVMNGGSSICSPTDVQLYVSDSGIVRMPCFIQSIQPLTADEARAFREAHKHKR
jgi:hypothetical protein